MFNTCLRRHKAIFDCVKANNPLRCWVSAFDESGIQFQDARQYLPMLFGGTRVAMFPFPHRPRRNSRFCGHFRLGKVGFDAFQKKMVAQRFRVDGDELSGAKSAVRKLVNDMDCPLCNSQQRAQPPLARSVPLSRFTSRVGGGSAFFVRLLRAYDHEIHFSLPLDSGVPF